MKAEELKDKSKDELTDKLYGLTKESFNLRFQRVNGQLENTARIAEVRKDIARLKTVISQKRKDLKEVSK